MEVAEPVAELRSFLDEGQDPQLRAFCEGFHPAALAEHLEEMEPEERVMVMTKLEPQFRAELLGHLEPTAQIDTVELFSDAELARTVTYMPSDERVDMLKILPEDRVEEVLRTVAKAEREDILRLGAYDEGTAGAIMTSEYAAVTADLTAREALDQLRTQAPDKETIYVAYVIDDHRHLIGLVSLKDLVVAKANTPVEDLMTVDPVVAYTYEKQEEVARRLSQYDLIAIPVVNPNNVLVGIVTFDDVLDVTEAETTTDFHRMAAAGLMTTSLRDASIWLLYQKRVPWLLILVFMNVFSGYAISRHEATIEQYVALVFFLPLLIDSGGNAGSQSATLMVRALATGDVHIPDWLRLLGREVLVALAIGISMGLAVSTIGVFRGGPDVAVVVAVTMVLLVLTGSLIGMLLPFGLTWSRLDPASASAPLVTSLADIAGVLIYFGIAAWYLELQPMG